MLVKSSVAAKNYNLIVSLFSSCFLNKSKSLFFIRTLTETNVGKQRIKNKKQKTKKYFIIQNSLNQQSISNPLHRSNRALVYPPHKNNW